MPGERDLDPEMSPLHFFGAEIRRAREAAAMTLADLGAVRDAQIRGASARSLAGPDPESGW